MTQNEYFCDLKDDWLALIPKSIMQNLFSVSFLYSILGLFALLCSLSIVLFKKEKKRAHWYLVLALLFWGIRMGVYASLFNPTTCHLPWIWPTYLILSLAYGPLFFLSVTELSDIRGVTPNQYLVFVPMAIISMILAAIYMFCDPADIQRIHDCAILNIGSFSPDENLLISCEYFCYYAFRSITFWLEAGIMIWSSWSITQYEKTVNEYFSSHEGKSIRQAKAIAILTTFSVIIVLLREAFPNYEPTLSLFKLILILISFLFQLFLTIMSFNISYTAFDIRRLLEEDDHRVCTEDNRLNAIANCWTKLEVLINEEKVFLKPDLNLIELSQRLGTNRTYMSQAIKQFSGNSFSDYINSARIEYAKQLLLDNEPLKNVEYSCGYTSTSTFYRQFQKQTGMSPTIWLSKERENQ